MADLYTDTIDPQRRYAPGTIAVAGWPAGQGPTAAESRRRGELLGEWWHLAGDPISHAGTVLDREATGAEIIAALTQGDPSVTAVLQVDPRLATAGLVGARITDTALTGEDYAAGRRGWLTGIMGSIGVAGAMVAVVAGVSLIGYLLWRRK